jgi:hypothetical protein
MKEPREATDRDRIVLAFKRALGREPKPEELAGLESFLAGQLAAMKTQENDPEAFLEIGQSREDVPSDAVEIAAWTQLCRVILNLHETLTRY